MNRVEARIMKELIAEGKLVKQGWITNMGVEPDVRFVDIMFNDGVILSDVEVYKFEWALGGESNHIKSWRPSKTQEASEKRFRDEIPELMGEVFPKAEIKAQEVDFHGEFEKMTADQQDAIINPKHYKMIPPEAYERFPDGLEYMNVMEYVLAHHNGIEGHLLGQIFKYATRLGKKDADLQDAKKIQWYANYLVDVIAKRSSSDT